jgi:hypothetical protein
MRKTFIIEAPEDELEKILTLFESGELEAIPDINILDMEIISDDQTDKPPITQMISLDAQPLLNLRLWLGDRIDELSQELGWILIPSPGLSAMRFPGEFDDIRAGLKQQEIDIPSASTGAYKNIDLETGSLRLYVIKWILAETTERPKWVLLVILKPQLQEQIHTTLRLQVREQTEILFDESLQYTSQHFLYTQIVGYLEERFWVNVKVNNRELYDISLSYF